MKQELLGILTKKIVSSTDVCTPEIVTIIFTADEFAKIEKMILLAKNEKIQIRIKQKDSEYYDWAIDELVNPHSLIRSDYDEGPSYILITEDGKLCFQSQDDNDETIKIESEQFDLNEIKWEPYVPKLG
jgi:hypothetical protein